MKFRVLISFENYSGIFILHDRVPQGARAIFFNVKKPWISTSGTWIPGMEKQKFSEMKVLTHREGCRARSKALDLGSSLAGVRGFESPPSHNI